VAFFLTGALAEAKNKTFEGWMFVLVT